MPRFRHSRRNSDELSEEMLTGPEEDESVFDDVDDDVELVGRPPIDADEGGELFGEPDGGRANEP